MSLESAKKYGFISSIINIILPIMVIFMVLGVIYLMIYQVINTVNPSGPFVLGIGLIAGIVVAMVAGIFALILFFLSMYRLSKYYREPAIFRNVLYGFLISTIGSIIIYAIVMTLILTTITSDSGTLINADFMNFLAQFMISYIIIFSATLIFAIINGFLYWKAFTKLGEKSGIETFNTVGILFLVGSIIPGAGQIILWIAWIFAAKSYKQIQPQIIPNLNATDTTNHTPQTTQTSPPPNFDKNYCTYCGTENINAIYCKHCGNPIQTTQTNP